MVDNILKFVFPKRCVICDSVLPYGSGLTNDFLCENCKSKIDFIKEPVCRKCGAMIDDENEAYCTRCKTNLYRNFEYGFGLCRYNDAVKESIHRIKYDGRKEYIDFYGKCIAKIYRNEFKKINSNCLIPVPIHKTRLRKRTYNQATELAYSISKELKKYGIDIPVAENVIYRIKNTKVLNALDIEARKVELNDAFKCKDCSNINSVIIVDDIYTSGNSINAVASYLKNAGVKKIYFVTIAVVDNL